MDEILKTVEDVGKIKSLAELQEYILALPKHLKNNGKLIALFDKRRLFISNEKIDIQH